MEKRDADTELVPLTRYLLHIASATPDWRTLEHAKWRETLASLKQ